ncbi:MAG: phage/plasmid primase, P4 family, partial [Dolichospermum sp.]
HKNIVADNSSEWKEVSKNNPCPLCGKPDWCSVSPDTSAVLCRRTDTAPHGWKKIKDSKDGYPIFVLDNGNSVKPSRGKKKVIAKPRVKVIPLPTNCSLVELTAIPTDIPKATKSKNKEGNEILITRYEYSDDKSIIREQWVDETKPKGYAKKFKPCRKEIEGYGSPNFIYNKGDELWGAYRIEEVLREVSNTDSTPMVLFQEGEGCVEIARSLGIASTCVDGSGWTTEGLTFAINPIREIGAGIIYLADNDAPGNKKAKQVEDICNTLQIPCIVIKASAICDIPDGGDIKEIMEQLNKEDFIERLQNEIHRAVESRSVVALDGGGDGNDDDDWSDSKPVKELPKHNAMASLLKPLMRNLKYRDDYHQWMRYKDGFWTVASEESIFQMVTDAIEELFPSIGFHAGYPSGVAKMLISRLLCSDWPEQPRNLLPFKNGILDLNTKKLLPHSPDYGFESIIDREHDPNATDWSVISDWMDFVFEGNEHQKHLLLCWYAAVLRGMSELHRFALFIGEGGTGKSTAMNLGTNLIGKQASHSLTLEALNSNSFQTANIYNKRLVCLNDADRYHGNMGIFKNITGGDEFSVERKFQQAFNAVFPGLVMATANNCVFTSTDSGLDRRQIIFRFDRRVPEIDTQFSKKLASQTSAFTNYLLNIPESEIIHSLLYKVDESGQAKQNELEALLQTNAVAVWMNNNLAYDPSSEIQIGSDKNNTSQLYGNYHDFSTKSGSNPRSSKEFSPEVIRLGKGSL